MLWVGNSTLLRLTSVLLGGFGGVVGWSGVVGRIVAGPANVVCQ